MSPQTASPPTSARAPESRTCYECGTDNKISAKFCKSCGADLSYVPWRPNWKWYAKTLGIVYAVLVGMFFAAKILLAPYERKIDPTWNPYWPDRPGKWKPPEPPTLEVKP